MGDGIVIDELPEKEKVNVFNECEYCISLDTQTAYSQIAALCGCKSIVIPEKGKTKSDYLKSDDVSYGVSYSLDENEISKAYEERLLLKDYYTRLNNKSKENVKQFVEFCKVYFQQKEY